MEKIKSYFYQSLVLIARSLKIMVNDRRQLILYIITPLIAILIICAVSTENMFAVKPETDHSINNGYPVFNWEKVVLETAGDNGEPNELIKPTESAVSDWDGQSIDAPTTPMKIDDEHFFVITNANQLAFLSKSAENGFQEYLTYNYILQCDIDLQSHAFTPIGTKEFPFTGTFDGNGHTISNLFIDSDEDNVGLFGYVASNAAAESTVTIKNPTSQTEVEIILHHNGILKNLQLTNASVKSTGKNVGIAAGTIANRAIITSVSIKNGSVYAQSGNVGGLVGTVNSDRAEIYICYATAEVTTKGENAGGLVGDLGSSRISACYSVCQIEDLSGGALKNIGTIVGNFQETENQFKSIFYDKEVNTTYKAICNTDYDGVAYGIGTVKLKRYSSELVPFKDIMNDYELLHMSEEDKARYAQEGYTPETDDDIESTYAFKKDGQIMAAVSLRIGLFMLVCTAFFVGTCNSIQEICKEKSILKREYMTNLNLGSYITSKLVVQAILCAAQMAIVTAIFMLYIQNKKELPTSGALLGSIWVEYFITLFLLALAADTTALIISACAKSAERSSTFIALILVIHIVFSNVLFELHGALEIVSYCLPSKWGYTGLAITSVFNDSRQLFFIDHPDLQLQFGNYLGAVNPDFINSGERLLITWGVLLLYSVVAAVICSLVLKRITRTNAE